MVDTKYERKFKVSSVNRCDVPSSGSPHICYTHLNITYQVNMTVSNIIKPLPCADHDYIPFVFISFSLAMSDFRHVKWKM